MKFSLFFIALLHLSIAAMESREKGLALRKEFGEIYEKHKLEAMKNFSQQEKALVSLYSVWAYKKNPETSLKLINFFARNRTCAKYLKIRSRRIFKK